MKRLKGFGSVLSALAAFALAAFALTTFEGCVSEDGAGVGQEQGLSLDYVVPSFLVPEEIWMQDALAGCEGRLHDDDIAVAWAEGAPSLGVVLDENGRAICVDTWQAIQIELDRVKGDPSPDPMRPLPVYRRPR